MVKLVKEQGRRKGKREDRTQIESSVEVVEVGRAKGLVEIKSS